MDPRFEFLLRMGDTTLILGHQVSAWCGHAPALEEDIALANIALDLLGHTQLWLEYAGEVEGKGRSKDDLAFLREAHEFRNHLLVERPNGDFGVTLMRQFLFDIWHRLAVGALKASSDDRIAAIADKASREVAYHADRSTDLVIRLGDGTEESNRRLQAALDALWPYTGEMFADDASDAALEKDRIAPLPSALRAGWEKCVRDVLKAAVLSEPTVDPFQTGARKGVHTENLGYLLAEMQVTHRTHAGATW